MIIRGRFIGDAPYFAVHLRSAQVQGMVWILADTGASRTTLLDRDVRLMDIAVKALEPALLPIVGIGGSVRSFLASKPDTSRSLAGVRVDNASELIGMFVQSFLAQVPSRVPQGGVPFPCRLR